MDHPPRMGVGHGLADLLENAEKTSPFHFRTPSRLQNRCQGASSDQLHCDEHSPVGQAPQFVYRDDPRMLELPADLRLLNEPPDQLWIVAVFVAHHLDGQVAAKVEVAALEDRSHAPASQLTHELISRR